MLEKLPIFDLFLWWNMNDPQLSSSELITTWFFPPDNVTIPVTFSKDRDYQSLPAIGVGHNAFVLGISFTILVNNPSEGRVDWGLEAQLDQYKRQLQSIAAFLAGFV